MKYQNETLNMVQLSLLSKYNNNLDNPLNLFKSRNTNYPYETKFIKQRIYNFESSEIFT